MHPRVRLESFRRRTFLRRIGLSVLAAFALISLVARAAQPAPRVKLETVSGYPFTLDSLKGKVVVLDFWAPWCVPCRKSFPFLDKLQGKHEAQGLKVVGLTLDDNTDAINAFLGSVPVGFDIARDRTGFAGEAFGVVAMPTTFLLDREGNIVARFEGGDSKVHARLEEAVSKLLKEGALPAGADVRVSAGAQATGSIKAWQRSYLADPIMNLDGDPITRMLKEHVHASKEAAAGDGGASGGGCGCN